MAPHSSTLAWKIPWVEEPGRLQSMGSLGVGGNWATSLWLFTFMHWSRKWQPTPVFLPGESHGQRSLVGCRSMGLHRFGHDWSDLAAAAAKGGGTWQIQVKLSLKVAGSWRSPMALCVCVCVCKTYMWNRWSAGSEGGLVRWEIWEECRLSCCHER